MKKKYILKVCKKNNIEVEIIMIVADSYLPLKYNRAAKAYKRKKNKTIIKYFALNNYAFFFNFSFFVSVKDFSGVS